jgi:hypothetical protein
MFLIEKSLPVRRKFDLSGGAILTDDEAAVLTHRLPVGGSTSRLITSPVRHVSY